MKPCETLVIRLRDKYYQVMITDDGRLRISPLKWPVKKARRP